jgi:hypothetical protein
MLNMGPVVAWAKDSKWERILEAVLHVFDERDDEMVEMDKEMLTAKILYMLQSSTEIPFTLLWFPEVDGDGKILIREVGEKDAISVPRILIDYYSIGIEGLLFLL